MTDPSRNNSDEKRYTALVYFHGIGDPRREISLGRFLDAFDLLGQSKDFSSIGRPRDFRYKSEVTKDKSIRGFVQFRRITKLNSVPKSIKFVRSYEAYWADEARPKLTFFQFLIWLFLAGVRPVAVLFSRWRNYPSIKLSSLHASFFENTRSQECERLEKLYRNFENWECRQRYRRGSFDEFLKYLSERNVKSQYGKMNCAAIKWKSETSNRLIMVNIRNLLYLLTSMIAIFLVWGASVKITNFASAFFSIGQMSSNLLSILVFSGFITAAWLYLRYRISDVVIWTLDADTRDRHLAKERIVGRAQALIRSICEDEQCRDCIIVGHSLGSSIAVEALLREGQSTNAVNIPSEEKERKVREIGKIKYVFCVGSPIQNIFDYFQYDRSISHRFSRTESQKRLSISVPPFVGGDGRPAIIVNFWSRFDPISSRIFSLKKTSAERSDVIFNWESLPSAAPSPLGTHAGYFTDPYVTDAIYCAIMNGSLPHEITESVDRDLARSFKFPIVLVAIFGVIVGLIFGFSNLGKVLFAAGAVVSATVLAFLVASAKSQYLGETKKYLGS